MYCLKITS